MILGIVIPVFTLFGGFLIPRDQIPGWWIWAYWISAIQYDCFIVLLLLLLMVLLISYPVEAMELNTMGGLTFDCKANQLVPLVNADGSIIQYPFYYFLLSSLLFFSFFFLSLSFAFLSLPIASFRFLRFFSLSLPFFSPFSLDIIINL